MALQAGDLQLLLDEHQYLAHALQHRQGLQHLLQLRGGRGGQAGGEIRQRRGFVGVEAAEEELQFLAVQGIEGHQFLQGIEDGDGVGTHFIVGAGHILGVFHLHQVGRLARQPAHDTEAAQALGNELDLAGVAHGLVNPHGRADDLEIIDGGLFGIIVIHQHQARHMLGRIADRLHGLHPGAVVHEDRDVLGREKGSFHDR